MCIIISFVNLFLYRNGFELQCTYRYTKIVSMNWKNIQEPAV